MLLSLSLGLVAGLGEELLFRHVLQQAIPLPAPLPLLLASLLFAAGHAITPTYALLSFLASLFFGSVYASSGLAVAATAHGAYDAVAVCATHWVVTRKSEGEKERIRSMEWLKD
ncbi:hypothetical protein TeGR_g6686 [Tetraparma gracilis]|uniref:CAAX prenyl protease 2/Lysostaphin resistance protein A-like domain-containing protein n=1 Tax=Tetraparma gracilis TaxID=2962635 RepID=A0ABQ6M5U6_9STRA|nr:hypothetical protein TeGR_g6686 [Tetraparma gracilis]